MEQLLLVVVCKRMREREMPREREISRELGEFTTRWCGE